MLQCSMKTAWHLTHRLGQLAMAEGGERGRLGGAGKVVEVDETYFGDLPAERAPQTRRSENPAYGPSFKRGILSLVERGGEVRSFYVERTYPSEGGPASFARTSPRKPACTPTQHRMYQRIGKDFETHETVNHSKKEYARGDVTTNTIEGFFSVFKRGMRGVYQQCDEKHLHRYLAEFDFRYNARQSLGVNDQQRTSRAVMGGKGKRLTYETIA